ncbi:hypothetical protein ZIOFF_076169 [Zingiber officinale]|uniref:Protein FAR1-RELATED SEQUENCE n=1 Tax=Zingiber officinale TaxID=94328 RepID=A0A8J5ES74_ZINOF|nr:hypothetical protein ZIOFF_076169 [Zingiber officinale]
MEYSSSEDDEMVEDNMVFDDADQQADEVIAPLPIVSHGGCALASVIQNAMENGLLDVADCDERNQVPSLGKGVEVLIMKRFVCLKEGHHKKKKVAENSTRKKRKRLLIRDGCPAMMEVVHGGPGKWIISKLVLEHTHIVVSPERVREIQLSHVSGKDREHKDYLKEMRRRVFREGDAQILVDYFRKMQAENAGCFYAMQTIVFACAVVMDETESSFTWMFETWPTAMCGQRPLTITTDQGKAVEAAVAKVYTDLHDELKMFINEAENVETFEVYWRAILDKYNISENPWLQILYAIRHRWIPAYLKDSFFVELSTRCVVTACSLQMFIAQQDQEIDSRYAKESQEDHATLNIQQILKTQSAMEKQPANIYTRAVFEKFQEELVEAFSYYPVTIQDGPTNKFTVARDGDAMCGAFRLPEYCILKRWTRKAKNGLMLQESDHEGQYLEESPIVWYNDLLYYAMKSAERREQSLQRHTG